eukprot:scaffold7955_cov47-Attheya_sp.AAC.1
MKADNLLFQFWQKRKGNALFAGAGHQHNNNSTVGFSFPRIVPTYPANSLRRKKSIDLNGKDLKSQSRMVPDAIIASGGRATSESGLLERNQESSRRHGTSNGRSCRHTHLKEGRNHETSKGGDLRACILRSTVTNYCEHSKASWYPEFYSFPPFFTIQPVLATREKQMGLWRELILKYHTDRKIKTLVLHDCPLWTNPDIGRELNQEAIQAVMNDFVKSGHGEWEDPDVQTRCRILWRKPEQLASDIYDWAMANGYINSVCTVYELHSGTFSSFAVSSTAMNTSQSFTHEPR